MIISCGPIERGSVPLIRNRDLQVRLDKDADSPSTPQLLYVYYSSIRRAWATLVVCNNQLAHP